jgi:hypothetical protein
MIIRVSFTGGQWGGVSGPGNRAGRRGFGFHFFLLFLIIMNMNMIMMMRMMIMMMTVMVVVDDGLAWCVDMIDDTLGRYTF